MKVITVIALATAAAVAAPSPLLRDLTNDITENEAPDLSSDPRPAQDTAAIFAAVNSRKQEDVPSNRDAEPLLADIHDTLSLQARKDTKTAEARLADDEAKLSKQLMEFRGYVKVVPFTTAELGSPRSRSVSSSVFLLGREVMLLMMRIEATKLEIAQSNAASETGPQPVSKRKRSAPQKRDPQGIQKKDDTFGILPEYLPPWAPVNRIPKLRISISKWEQSLQEKMETIERVVCRSYKEVEEKAFAISYDADSLMHDKFLLDEATLKLMNEGKEVP